MEHVGHMMEHARSRDRYTEVSQAHILGKRSKVYTSFESCHCQTTNRSTIHRVPTSVELLFLPLSFSLACSSASICSNWNRKKKEEALLFLFFLPTSFVPPFHFVSFISHLQRRSSHRYTEAS